MHDTLLLTMSYNINLEMKLVNIKKKTEKIMIEIIRRDLLNLNLKMTRQKTNPYEKTNPNDRFITVEKKQIRSQKVWNPEIQSDNKSEKGHRKKSQKKLIDKYGK